MSFDSRPSRPPPSTGLTSSGKRLGPGSLAAQSFLLFADVDDAGPTASTAQMSDAGATVPPGRMGLPFLGEVTDFLADGFGFVETRTRQLGPVFKTKILGRPTAVIVGPDAAGQFIDESKVQREGAMLP